MEQRLNSTGLGADLQSLPSQSSPPKRPPLRAAAGLGALASLAAILVLFPGRHGPLWAAAAVLAAAALWPGRAAAWELHNRSSETRIFDEYRDHSSSPYTKTVRPGGMLSFTNSNRINVVDRKTGQTVNNPGFKMMEITKEGALRFR